MAGMADAHDVAVEEKLRLLQQSRLFKGLPAEDLRSLAAAAEVVTFPPGGRVVRQGEPSDYVYLITEGHVQVLGRTEDDGTVAETVISWLGPGDVAGELSSLDDEPPEASGIAVTSTTCLRLTRDEFTRSLERHWPVTRELLRALAQRLRATVRHLAENARDPLTGLSQQRAAAEFYERELAVARRAARQGDGAAVAPMALLLVDVIRLRHMNDRLGPSAGDEVLRTLARVLAGASRATDLVARYEEDEFLLLLPGAGQAGAEEVASRIRRALQALPASVPPFQVGIGIALADHTHPRPLAAVLAKARDALQRDKRRAGAAPSP
jgi:diguanylate cyclase (GGDEF)-like protein